MFTSLALIILMGLGMGALCQKLQLPKIIGMLFTGLVLGPYCLDLLDESILAISGDLRKMALLVILLKSGLSLDIQDLKKVGRPAVLLSFLPASFEIVAYVILGPRLLGISSLEAALMGAVLSAVSPAVVVPRMVDLIEKKYGRKKAIPQMIMAGASCDDIFVLVLFTSFLGMVQGGSAQWKALLNVPLAIVLGILLGGLIGYGLYFYFEGAYQRNRPIRNTTKVLILLGISFCLLALEEGLKGKLAISGLLAVMSMASVLRMKTTDFVAGRLAEKFGKLWIGAEVMLFVLVGAAVDIRYTLGAGLPALLLIVLALGFRSLGVFLSTSKTNLNTGERVFCILSYLPKATVQAAIGSVPLSLGLPCGKLILSVAVLGILITAPLGAFAMDGTYKKLLKKEDE